jgi:D-beta-D-heptose 7-phosphate kinase/D-beta-D-heptose 1-phosphate adenosyltransferase
VKTRIIARNQQVVRADREERRALDENELAQALSMVTRILPEVQGVIISDYGKGVVCKPLIKKVVAACGKHGLFVSVDPKVDHFELYSNVSVITPNLLEAHTALNIPYHQCTDEQIEQLGWKLLDKLGLACLLVTLGERGMGLFERKGRRFTHLPTVARKVYDVTGAGDTVISVFSAASVCGAAPLEAAWLSNHAAGLTVAELGTASVRADKLLSASLRGEGIARLQ